MDVEDEGPDGVRNQRLYDAVRGYCERAAAILEAELGDSGNRAEYLATVSEFVLQDGGRIAEHRREEVAWHRLVGAHDDTLTRTEEHGWVIEALEQDQTIAKHLGRQVWMPGHYAICPRARVCTERFLWDVLHHCQGGFDAMIFDRLYRRLEDFFYKEEFDVRYLAPLGGFEMQTDALALGPRFRAVRISDSNVDELLSSWVASSASLFYRKPWVGMRPCGLELCLKEPKRVGVSGDGVPQHDLDDYPDIRASREFDAACSALRVFKQGSIGYDHVLRQLSCWHPTGSATVWSTRDAKLYPPLDYVLSREEVAEFSDFWSRWRQWSGRKDLEVGLHRFDLGIERRLPTDRLIDYVIGFEALLLPGADGEYRYRMSLRAATLLGKDPHERLAVQKNVREAYDVRSGIVHGGTGEHETIRLCKALGFGKKRRLVTSSVTLAEFVLTMEEYLRRVINELGKRCEKRKLLDVMNELDRMVLGFSEADDGREG